MHKYILALTKYSEAGALTSEKTFVSADTPQALSDLYTKYDRMRYTTVNEDGTTSVGMKMYQVKPMQGGYSEITDWDDFCTTNAVLR